MGNKTFWIYGMRLRGFSPGCQPKNGLYGREDDATGRYHDIIIYERQLSEEEIRDYELDYIKNVSEEELNNEILQH